MSSQRKFRGISEHQEVDRNTRRPDTRPLLTRIATGLKTTDGAIVFHVVVGLLALISIKMPLAGEVLALGTFIYWRVLVDPKRPRTWNFPYRVPARAGIFDGSYPATKDEKTKKWKFKVGDGLTFFGKEFGTNLEIWAGNSDLRTHNLVLGTTGSGKTELLLGLVFNALIQNSGLIYCDGKGDVALYDNVFRLARILDRTDDILVVNFMSSGRDLSGKSFDRLTNTLNPYATSSSSMQNELNMSLMDDGGGGGDMWKSRAISFVQALSRPLCWARDRGCLLLDPGAYIAMFELREVEKLVWDKKFVGIGGEEFTIKDPEFDDSLKPLETYLGTLPGYQRDKKGKQEQKTLEQHGFITMQLTRTFSDLTFTYGHIFRHKLGEIDFVDVVLNRRILLVLLPSLERSPDSLKALGKLVVGNLKAMMGTSLGSGLEGERRQIIEARPTKAPVPFYDILDEYGYYAVLGFAVAPAQARSLAHSITFAAQDFSSLQKASKEEADATWENTNVRAVGRITSGEESETFRRIRGVAGEAEVDSFGQKELRTGDIFDTYHTNRDTTTEKVARIAYDDLASQENGEFHFLVGKKEDGGTRGRVRIIRGRSFYTGMGRKEMHTELRINHFLKIEPPANIDKIDYEALTKLVAQKLVSGEVATEFGGGGVEGVRGGVATTYVAKVFHATPLSGLKLLERGMVSLASLVLRTRGEYQQAAAGARVEDFASIDAGLAAAATVKEPEPAVVVQPAPVFAARTLAPEARETAAVPKSKAGGTGGRGGGTTASGGGLGEHVQDLKPVSEGGTRAPVVRDAEPPRTSLPASPGVVPTPESARPAASVAANVMNDADDDYVVVGGDDGIDADAESGSVDKLAGVMNDLVQMTDGWEQTSPVNRERVAEVTAMVEAAFLETLDDDGLAPPDDLEEQAQNAGRTVADAVAEHNKYAEAPIPSDMTEASFDDLLRKLAEVAGRESGGEVEAGRQ
jgi:intracellular multiplication protein IcmO